jgi:hypothetical protein
LNAGNVFDKRVEPPPIGVETGNLAVEGNPPFIGVVEESPVTNPHPYRGPRPPRGPGRWKAVELTRAMRAAKTGKIDVERFEVDPASGKISVIVRGGQNQDNTSNPWDKVLTDAPDAKRAP